MRLPFRQTLCADTPDIYADGTVRLQSIDRERDRKLRDRGGPGGERRDRVPVYRNGPLPHGQPRRGRGAGRHGPDRHGDRPDRRPRLRPPGIRRQCRRKRGDQCHGTARQRRAAARRPRDRHPDTRFGDLLALDAVAVDGADLCRCRGGDGGSRCSPCCRTGGCTCSTSSRPRHVDLGNVTTLDRLVGRHSASGLRHHGGGAPGSPPSRFARRPGPDADGASDSGGTTTGATLDDLLMGGSGDDLLPGRRKRHPRRRHRQDTLHGGDGRRPLRPVADGAEDEIADFDPGLDRLDLSAWPMLYDPGQLTITPTASGAEVTWGDETLTLTGSGGGRSSGGRDPRRDHRRPAPAALPRPDRRPRRGSCRRRRIGHASGRRGHGQAPRRGGNDTLSVSGRRTRPARRGGG
jgi:hypothetical protein